MKFVKLLSVVFSLSVLLWACGGNTAEHADHADQEEVMATEADAHGEGKEYTSAYVCPMHCEGSGSDEMGKCPVCGMDYVAQAEHTSDGHSH
ncbi:MAG: heavy metal-binding domain-containing protein [Saprospiraceae bacterium]|nr:hypothetical protein [Lewinella sp.]